MSMQFYRAANLLFSSAGIAVAVVACASDERADAPAAADHALSPHGFDAVGDAATADVDVTPKGNDPPIGPDDAGAGSPPPPPPVSDAPDATDGAPDATDGPGCPFPVETGYPACLGDNDKRACIADRDCGGVLKWDGTTFPPDTSCWSALSASIGLTATNFSTAYRGDSARPYAKACEMPVPFDIDALRLDPLSPAPGYREAALLRPDPAATSWSSFTTWRDGVQAFFRKPFGTDSRIDPPRPFWDGNVSPGLPADLAGVGRERWANDSFPDGHPNIGMMLDYLRLAGGSVPPVQAAATVGRIVNERLGACGIPAAPKYFFVLTLAQTACPFNEQFKPDGPFGERVNATPLAYIQDLPTIDTAPQAGLASGQAHPTDAVLWIVDPTSGCANCSGPAPE